MNQTPIGYDSIKESFDRDGFVKVESVLSREELAVLREETQDLVDGGWVGHKHSWHYYHSPDPVTGTEVFNRVQFLFPKAVIQPNPYLALLGHPKILKLVEKLLEGRTFVITGEALVFKMPFNGREVPMHTDGAAPGPEIPQYQQYFNVDIYLDDATVENGCLLAAPGSHKVDCLSLLKETGFDFPGLVEVPMKAGDVLFHNTRVVHGSRRSASPKLRRTIYYEFQTTEHVWLNMPKIMANHPGTQEYDVRTWVTDRARLIQEGIRVRRACGFAQNEVPYTYNAPEAVKLALDDGEELNLLAHFGGDYL